MKDTVHKEEFLGKLKSLVGECAWAAAGGGCTGSIVSFEFGERLLRERPVENPSLPEEMRTHQGELSLLIYCAWRIEEGSTHIVGGSGDWDEKKQGLATDSLKTVLDSPVADVELNSFLDLTIAFHSGTRLHVFCDQSACDQSGDQCYSFFLRKTGAYTVVSKGMIRFEGDI